MTAATLYRLRLALAASLAILAAGLSVPLAVAVSAPRASLAEPVPLTAVSEARAVAAAEAGSADLSTAEVWTRRTLDQKPGEAAAWARLAWIASERSDTEALQTALDRSYTVAPYGPDITAWRLRFAYEHWGDLTPELRRLAEQELMVAAAHRPRLVRAIREDVINPWSRIAFDATVERAKADAR